ncbi:MAG: NACHT domain-containing protein [Chloroflexota bacterium]
MLEKRYGTIQILGQPRPQKLGKVYTDVYLHEKPTHTYAMQIEKLEEMFKEQNKRFGRQERTDGLAFAKEHDRLFILGKPGAGKTTFLKYLTMQAAGGDIPLIPIFVSLNDFQHQNVDLLDYMAQQFEICDFPEARPFIEQLVKKGKGLILFDGLDEVSKEDNQRTQITRQLKQFIINYDGNRFAITCRIAASDYNFQNFAYVEMADFTDEQVEAFVRRWFAESQPKIKGFLKELEESDNKGIKEMTTSPLLLTLLCIQYDSSMALPPSRSEIYEEALEVLLKTWDGHRDINRGDLIVEDEDHYKALTFKRKMQLMSRLAWGTFKEGKLFIEQKWLEENIVKYLGKIPKGPDPDLVDGGVVLKAMESQHGLLVEQASRIYSFSHLTLQEYFTAKYIVEHTRTDAALSTLVSQEKIIDSRWREVFLFVAELLPTGDTFIIWFAETLQQMTNNNGLDKLIAIVEEYSLDNPCPSRGLVPRIIFLDIIVSGLLNHQTYPFSPHKDEFLDLAVDIKDLRNNLKIDHYVDNWNLTVSNLGMIEDTINDDPNIFKFLHARNSYWLYKWFHSHVLILDCLDLVTLSNFSRINFEDKYLFRLPPHARPKLDT